jgi:hypothetical protein
MAVGEAGVVVGEAGVVVGDGAVSVLALPQVRWLEQRWPRRTMVTGTAILIMATAMATDTRTVMATDIRTTAAVGKMALVPQCLFANPYWPRPCRPEPRRSRQRRTFCRSRWPFLVAGARQSRPAAVGAARGSPLFDVESEKRLSAISGVAMRSVRTLSQGRPLQRDRDRNRARRAPFQGVPLI